MARNSAPIGTIKEFGGRNYIKTTDGWKFHGKGTGAKAQQHAAGSKESGFGAGTARQKFVSTENISSEKPIEDLKKQQSSTSQEKSSDKKSSGKKEVHPIGTIKEFAGRPHIKTETGWKYYSQKSNEKKGDNSLSKQSKSSYNVETSNGLSKPTADQKDVLKGLQKEGVDVNHPNFTVRFEKDGKGIKISNIHKPKGHLEVSKAQNKGGYSLRAYNSNITFNDTADWRTQLNTGAWHHQENTLKDISNIIKQNKYFGEKEGKEEYIKPSIHDSLKTAFGSDKVTANPNGSFTIDGGTNETHDHYINKYTMISQGDVEQKMKSNGLDPKVFDIKSEKYDPGSEKGWKVTVQQYTITPKKKR